MGSRSGVQGAAGQRSKRCFGLTFEQRSPPEGPLAQSWGNPGSSHPSGLAPAPVPRVLLLGEPWAGQRQLSGCTAHPFLPGPTFGSPWVNTWVQVFWRKGLDLVGRGWEANAGSSPSPAGMAGGKKKGSPIPGCDPLAHGHRGYHEVTPLAKVKISRAAAVRSSSPHSEPRLRLISRDTTTLLPGEQSPVLVFKETTHPPYSGSSCRRYMRGRRCRNDEVLLASILSKTAEEPPRTHCWGTGTSAHRQLLPFSIHPKSNLVE